MSDRRHLDVSGALFYIEVQATYSIILRESIFFNRDIHLNETIQKTHCFEKQSQFSS